LNAQAAKHGYGVLADAITIVDGKPVVADPDQRRWILDLREDPYLSALMACEMVKQSRERLARQTERAPTKAELYLSHFLGSNGAARLLKLAAEKPDEKAPKLFPRAAKANQAIFFAKEDNKREEATVAQVQARIAEMMNERVQRYAKLDHSSVLAAQLSRDPPTP
jgi:hypothetical protein